MLFVPMDKLFEAADQILDKELCPLHYGELTMKALKLLEIDPKNVPKNVFRKIKEDVREKMLLADWHKRGYLYTGPNYFAGAKIHWFIYDNKLFNPDARRVRICGSAHVGYTAALELALRQPYLQTKLINSQKRWEGAARGLVIEHHIKEWIKTSWPQIYLPPENENKLDMPCDHDFRLLIPSKNKNMSLVKVDIMGPTAQGVYKLAPGKHIVDIHLLGSIDNEDVWVHGFITRETFMRLNKPFSEWSPCVKPITLFIVWLNCECNGFSYTELKELAKTKIRNNNRAA